MVSEFYENPKLRFTSGVVKKIRLSPGNCSHTAHGGVTPVGLTALEFHEPTIRAVLSRHELVMRPMISNFTVF